MQELGFSPLFCFYPRGQHKVLPLPHITGLHSPALMSPCHQETAKGDISPGISGLPSQPGAGTAPKPCTKRPCQQAKFFSGFLLSEQCHSAGNRADTWQAQHRETAMCDRLCHVLPGNGPASCPEHRNNTHLYPFLWPFLGASCGAGVQGEGCRGAGCSRAMQVSHLQHPSPGACLRHQLEGGEGELSCREATCY